MAGGDLKIVDKSEAGQPADLQTEADRRAQFCIVQSLQKQFRNLKIIGEEVRTYHLYISYRFDFVKIILSAFTGHHNRVPRSRDGF